MAKEITLKQEYTSLLESCQVDPEQAETAWQEIVLHYSAPGRYYHNLQHLADMQEALASVVQKLQDRKAAFFALYCHDIIYDPSRGDNEIRSAHYAFEKLPEFGLTMETISRCQGHILATKDHSWSPDRDTNYFTDADLSVLGSERNHYLDYAKNIRKEFGIYSDEAYVQGRGKILQQFLEMDRIFKTEEFARLEMPARRNIGYELQMLETDWRNFI